MLILFLLLPNCLYVVEILLLYYIVIKNVFFFKGGERQTKYKNELMLVFTVYHMLSTDDNFQRCTEGVGYTLHIYIYIAYLTACRIFSVYNVSFTKGAL